MNWDEAHLLGDLGAQEERRMTDDPVKQTIKELQDIVHCDCAPDYLDRGRHSHVCLHYMAESVEIVANRIEELEAKLNFLVQPDSACPHPAYRGWVIADESNGNGTFWYAYTYDWKSGEWDSPHFMMVSGDFDDVTAEIDRRTGGQKDE